MQALWGTTALPMTTQLRSCCDERNRQLFIRLLCSGCGLSASAVDLALTAVKQSPHLMAVALMAVCNPK